ncbi:hypothetical protein BDR26DRAFT_325426, partial [Obelidium mucronatum]
KKIGAGGCWLVQQTKKNKKKSSTPQKIQPPSTLCLQERLPNQWHLLSHLQISKICLFLFCSMAFGFPQGAITKEAIDYFKSNEPDILFYASLDKLQDLVQYCTVKEYHDGNFKSPFPMRVVIPFCFQAYVSPYAMFINSNFYANGISDQFLTSRTGMENAFKALLSLKVTSTSPYPSMLSSFQK